MSETLSGNAVAALEDLDAAGRGLRIEFVRLGDRYAHRILAVGYEELAIPLLESIEGTPDDPWPPSPALQALNIDELEKGDETNGSAPVAMLVGMSGKSHWSLSVETRGRRLDFDAACRVKESVPILGSRYCVVGRVSPKLDGPRALLHFGSGRCALEVLPANAASEPASWRVDNPKRELSLSVSPELIRAAMPTTLRWAYSVLLRDV